MSCMRGGEGISSRRLGFLALAFAVLLATVTGAQVGNSEATRGADVRTDRPLARIGSHVMRVRPLTLEPTRPRVALGEYHDTWSYSPDGSSIAFGISAPPPGPGSRIGIRVANTSDLETEADLQTGVYAAALAWLEPQRIVALLGVGGTLPFPPPPYEGTVITIDPETGEVHQEADLPFGDSEFHCDAAEAPGVALLVLANSRLFTVGTDSAAETVELPSEFEDCGQVVVAPDNETAFAIAKREDVVAEVDLSSRELTVHDLPEEPGTVEALAAGPNTLVLARRDQRGRPLGVETVDLDEGSRRTIDRKAGEARIAAGTALAFDGARREGNRGIGLRGYSLDGERSFTVLRGNRVSQVLVHGHFAYAMRREGLAVVDVVDGVIESRSDERPPLSTELLNRPTTP